MACGYDLAAVFTWEPKRRQRFLLLLGGGLLALFLVFRGTNLGAGIYGLIALLH